MEFSERASSLCQDIYRNSIIGRTLAHQLKDLLIAERVISDEDTFDTVSNNVAVKSLLVRHIALGSSRNPQESCFGFNGISDFDLFHNCVTDEKLYTFISRGGMTFSEFEIGKLKKSRKNMRQFVNRIRANVIFHFELPETPLKNLVKTKKQIADKLAADTTELGERESGKRSRESKEDDMNVAGTSQDERSAREVARDSLLLTLNMLNTQYTSLMDVAGGGVCVAVDFEAETLYVEWDGSSFEHVVQFDTLLGEHFLRSSARIA
jgi:hypothetical protein